jgi:hypothetical protein
LIYKRYIVFLCAASMLCRVVCAQRDTLTFKITKPTYSVEVKFTDTVCRVYQKNYFELILSKDIQLSHLEIRNGKIIHLPNQNKYYVTFKQAGPSYIKVYAKNARGENFVALLQQIQVVDYELPLIYLSGVKADSAIDLEHLIRTGVFTAYSAQLKQSLPVVSFGMALNADTIYIKGNGFPIEIKNRFRHLTDGNQLEFFNIRVQFHDEQKTVRAVERFSVFITETDQYSVGSRKFIENKTFNPAAP